MTAQIEASLPERRPKPRERVVVESRVRRVRAPFFLRCGAMLIDYSLVIGVLAFATLIARAFGGGTRASGETTIDIGYFAALVVLVLDFLLLPVLASATVGKWATGLRIERQSGERLGLGRALLRHTVGYLVSLLTLGLGFLLAIFDGEGRALHDRIAGTVVVRERTTTPARSVMR
jgi:uncharacterized RDD family membrane protein YckC